MALSLTGGSPSVLLDSPVVFKQGLQGPIRGTKDADPDLRPCSVKALHLKAARDNL